MMTWFYSASAAATLLVFFSPSLVDLDHHKPPQLPVCFCGLIVEGFWELMMKRIRVKAGFVLWGRRDGYSTPKSKGTTRKYIRTKLLFILLVILFLYFPFLCCEESKDTTNAGVSIERPVLEVTPAPLSGHSATYGVDVQNTLRCARVAIYGISRLNLLSYASSFHISVAPSAAIPERLHSQVQVCLHRDNSLGWCECQKDEWKSVSKGVWSADMSPYDKRYADVRINGQTSVSNLCLISLVLGLALLLAPIISSWVPCCHSSSMAIVIFPVIIILLFQVAIVVILSIILAGAALGDRIVRKFVFPKQDGTKHAGVAKFVILKWGMRIIGSAFIFQSTTDPPLANGALVSFAAAYLIIKHEGSVNGNPPQQWNRGTDGSDSFMEGHVYSSTFYNNRKRLTENERVESTRKFTDQALAELIASPAFSAWFIANADRIRVDPHEPAKNVNKLRALKELSSMAMAYWRRVINLSMSKTNTLIGIITDHAIWSGGDYNLHSSDSLHLAIKMRWFFFSAAVAAVAILLLFLICPSFVARDHQNPPPLPGVSIERPVLPVTPSPLSGHSATYDGGVQNTLRCARVPVYGISRLNLLSYASSFHISVAHSAAISEKLHSQTHVCLHRDISLGLCECQKDEWESVQKGIWSAVMSPYETRYVDVRINGQIPDSVTIALEEDLQDWSLTSLLLGLALLFAPIITSRVPFCHSKQDGTKAAGVARFVILKWEMRIIGSTFIFQSTIDPPLAKGTLASFAVVYIVVKCLSVWNEGSVNGRTADTDEFTRGYFSTYHNLGNREMFTENQWVESTQRYTEQALADLMASPAFIAWLTESTGRIRVDPHEPAKNVSRLGALRNLLPWPWPFQEDSEI
ncbi:hypothetical protein Ahy_A06g029074 isoform B [Arachis hypogaea]|uniref:Uncharacterized protein n=1 Tax=Arachis hypogaea TaxID=3818 RepID=A0A445CS81_ARAHY|nr:hypothetical protein Ahy_A06g029074 isoform B [Arachis hypogaea]